MGQIAFKFFAGAVAGLLAWMVTEFSKGNVLPSMEKEWTAFEIRMIMMLGLLVGLTIGGLNGWLKGSRRHALIGMALGATFGAMGSFLGYTVGGTTAEGIFGVGVFTTPHPFPVVVMARTLVGVGLGGGIGLGIGAASLNFRRTIQGLLGGLLGGAMGGALFDTVSLTVSGLARASGEYEAGQPGRAVLCLLIGAGVGLLIGIVERVSRVAWVRLNLGRNEGKEWVLDTQTSHIGRDERANIPLFGDMSVEPLHCSIVRQGDAYWLYDAGTPGGTLLNGHPVQQAPLFPGAVIQVGSFPLQFQLREGSAPARAAERMRGQPMVVPQIQQPMPAPAPVAPQPVPTLVAASGQRYPVGTSLEIGREGSGIALPDPQASRKHARVLIAPSGAMIEDLGSTNGTFVNGNRISTQALRPGDEIKIGQSVFRYEG